MAPVRQAGIDLHLARPAGVELHLARSAGHQMQLARSALERHTPHHAAWLAVVLICAATVLGAWLARRAGRPGFWLLVASAVMLVTAVTDIIPEVWRDAADTGVPLWLAAVTGILGYLLIALFTRRRHGHAGPPRPRPKHAPGMHRRVEQTIGATIFGGTGTAAALTTPRVVEGAALVLIVSLPVILSMVFHSAGEGLALAALLEGAGSRLRLWVTCCALSPAIGVLFACLHPLPLTAVPLLLALVGGVLLRTALVGLRVAVAKRRAGELHHRHVAVSMMAASTVGALMLLAH